MGALLVSELFPPEVGGSAELLANVYGRLHDIPVTVLTHSNKEATSGSVACRVLREPIRTTHWGLLHPKGLYHHFRVARRIRQLSAPARTVVHCARGLPEGLDAYLASLMTRRHYICWAHGEEMTYARSSKELRALMALVYRHAAALFANSNNTSGMLESFGSVRSKITVVYPGVDVERFRPDAAGAAELRAQWARPDELLLLTVGRLQRRKGHDLMLQAVSRLMHDGISVRYLIVGSGEESARLQRLVSDLGIGERVIFAGFVNAELLPAYYAAADVFVHPNRVEGNDFEGFGIVFLEAAAAGLPVIAGASGGAPEAVTKDVTGLLVSGTDVSELQATIRTLALAPDLRKQMGAAGRRRVARDFSWERAAGQVREVHRKLADGRA
jgi:phosphatidylinositol alpha-1,6-mannosyltransferase